MKIFVVLMLIGMLPCIIQAADQRQDQDQKQVKIKKQVNRECVFRIPVFTQQTLHKYCRDLLWDSLNIWKNVFTLSSMKVMTATIPLFLASKPADHIVHRQFYDPVTHKNINQPSTFLQFFTTSEDAVAIPFLAFGSFGIFGRDEKLRRQSQVFITGLLWTFVAKITLKEIVKHDVACRPGNGNFPKREKWDPLYGAIPSGHSSLFAYMGTYWGMQLGPRWAVPLGAYTLTVMALTVATNRHYLSQVFVGAGLGVLFGVAASKTFDGLSKFEHFSVALDTDYRGNPAFTLAYDF